MGSFLLWWAAVSTIDVAPHVWDAFDPKVMLLGGKTAAESDGHDWQNILGDLGTAELCALPKSQRAQLP